MCQLMSSNKGSHVHIYFIINIQDKTDGFGKRNRTWKRLGKVLVAWKLHDTQLLIGVGAKMFAVVVERGLH